MDTWYEEYPGIKLSKLKSSEEGISLWPDTSTAIGVRLDEFNKICICSPFCLEDIFELKSRWNNNVISYDTFPPPKKLSPGIF
ncbi:nucleotidyltransferase family protein [Enterobacter roggenkampii]